MNTSNIPQELREHALWCLWRYELVGESKTKRPINPMTGGYAQPNNPDTFTTFEKTLQIFCEDKIKCDGLGLGIFNGYSAIDIDHCIQNGKLSAMAQDIVSKMNSYTEISPSGTGIRIIFKTNKQFDSQKYYIKNSDIGLEIYINGMTKRYVTITSRNLNKCLVREISTELDEILEKYMKRSLEAKFEPNKGVSNNLLEIGIQNDEKLRELWNSQPSGSGGNESETDMALCSKLNYWCNNDEELVYTAFLSSPYATRKDSIHQRKLNREDYLLSTIRKTKQARTASMDNAEYSYRMEKKELDNQKLANVNTDIETSMQLYFPIEDIEYKYEVKFRCLSNIIELDRLIGGFTYDCITLWSSQTNGGKSTLLGMITREIIKQGKKVFYFAGEHTKEKFQNILYRQVATKDQIECREYKHGIKNYFIKPEYKRQIELFYQGKVFIYNSDAPRDINTMLTAMQDCYEKYGVKDFVIDNLMQIEMVKDNALKEQTDITEKLRKFAINNECNIHLIAHPRKGTDNTIRLSMFDIAGSQNIVNKSYNVISIIRKDQIRDESLEKEELRKYCFHKGYDFDEADCILEVLKQKDGAGTGIVCLKYDPLTLSFIEMSKKDMSFKLEEYNKKGKKQNEKYI